MMATQKTLHERILNILQFRASMPSAVHADLDAVIIEAINDMGEALEFYANHYPGIEIRDGGDRAAATLKKVGWK